MTIRRDVKPDAEWVDDRGIRNFMIDGEQCFELDALPQWIMSVDPVLIEDAEKAAAIREFQRKAPLLQQAAQFRLAVELLKSFGATLPEEFRSPRLTVVEGGAQ